MNISEKSKIVLHLSLINGIGSKVIQKITAEYSLDELKNLYLFEISDFLKIGLGENFSRKIFYGLKDKLILEKELEILNKNKNYHIISPYDEIYPSNLKEIENYPPVLYLESLIEKKSLVEKIFFGCVSSRMSNFYGKRAIDYFLNSINTLNVSITSGGAIGGDTMFHEAAIKNNLKTIAVLGSGLNHKYPKNNLKLFEKIIENEGCLISQFSFNIEPTIGTFPARNMVIAGISKAIFVAQANEKSGTLITAQAALEFGRSVGVLPGLFDDTLSKGCHKLLKQGASLIESKEDLYELLSLKIENNLSFKNKNIKKEENIEDKICNFCINKKNTDEIIEFFKDLKNATEINSILFSLLIDGRIDQDIMGFWIKK